MQQTDGGVTLTIDDSVIHSHPGIVSGRPVFTGTRVPVNTLFDHLSVTDSTRSSRTSRP